VDLPAAALDEALHPGAAAGPGVEQRAEARADDEDANRGDGIEEVGLVGRFVRDVVRLGDRPDRREEMLDGRDFVQDRPPTTERTARMASGAIIRIPGLWSS
jgi:hypothetical protein